ncbi:MAG: dephospho-CoA kinase [Candidatus Krumholzibacteriota bacterium]|nr:dephospho-CoA kinase [Candidatus Krumholzibacteriota bacterium]
MSAKIIVVTGGIGSGKSTVASKLAEKGGYIIDADREAHGIFKDPLLKERLRKEFGDRIFTRAGAVSRGKLGAVVFDNGKMLDSLNRLVRPFVKERISEIVKLHRKKDRYIVLDAVLFFQYKFRFKADLVILTEAAEKRCMRRIMKRDSLSLEEAEKRIEIQRGLKKEWELADIKVNTDRSIRRVMKEVAGIRDDFLRKNGI